MRKHWTALSYATVLLMSVSGAALAQSSNTSSQTASATPDAASGAADFTCAQLASMDTAAVPGVLYFLSGYGQGQLDNNDVNKPSALPDAAGVSTEPQANSKNAEIGNPVKLPAEALAEPAANAGANASAGTTANMSANSGMAGSGAAPASGSNPAGQDPMRAAETTTAVGHPGAAEAMNGNTSGSGSASTGVAQNNAAAGTSGKAGSSTGADLSQAQETSAAANSATSNESSMAGGQGGDNLRMAALAGYFSIPVEDVVTRCQQSPTSKVSDVMRDANGNKAGMTKDQTSSQ